MQFQNSECGHFGTFSRKTERAKIFCVFLIDKCAVLSHISRTKTERARMITKAEIQSRIRKPVSNEDKFKNHVGCPRCGGTKKIARTISNNQAAFFSGWYYDECDFWGGEYRITERALAYAGVEAPGRN